ncbi:MAG TPA: transposase, partial [Actinoplanes sp.]|nr:transposase [Actinoplanes sp.]
PAARRATGLARALQAVALVATTLPVPRGLAAYKPVLAAHVAMLNARHAAADALREVLRELYPAALRAYADPAQHLPMAVLDALPEPGRLVGAGGRDSADVAREVIDRLSAAGLRDASAIGQAVTALHVAITESPRRGGPAKELAPAAGDTVRLAIAAVRSCETACDALLSTLTDRANAGRRGAGPRAASEPNLKAVGPASADSARFGQPAPAPEPSTRAGRRARQQPAAASTPSTPRPVNAPPVAPTPVDTPPSAPRPVTAPPLAPAASTGIPTRTPHPQPANRPVSVPPPPPGMTPIVPGSRPGSSRGPAAPASVPPAETGQPFRPTITNAAMRGARAERQRTVIPPRPNTRTQGPPAPTSAPGFGAADYSPIQMPAPRTDPTRQAAAGRAEPVAEPGSRANWPLVAGADDRAVPNGTQPTAAGSTPGRPSQSDGRVRPPWQSDDLPAEPPSLRLVEPQPVRPTGPAAAGDGPALRLVDRDQSERGGRSGGSATQRSTLTALDRSAAPPVEAEGDGDLLIFAAARSAWFTGRGAEAEPDWTTHADTGWRAAEKAAQPAVAAETSAGLPQRVPQANLVPGSPLREERPLRIVRDAASIAAHTTGYFQGWRRGQEIGGYAIGGRPGRESAGGWDFTRDGAGQSDEYRHNSGYQR